MGSRKGLFLSLTSILLICTLLTMFLFLVYNLKFDSASDDFYGLTVMDYSSEPGMPSELNVASLRGELVAWAAKNKAVLFYKGINAAGIAVADYAGWMSNTLRIDCNGLHSKEAVVLQREEVLSSYVDGDVLFPGYYNYKIVGWFNQDDTPTFQGDAFYFFPMEDITSLQGLLFTNCKDYASVSNLAAMIEEVGFSVTYQSYHETSSNILDVVKNMLLDDFVTRSLLFAFLGLVSSAVFAGFLLYRESGRKLAIHHLYGASYARIFLKNLLRLLLAAVAGTALGYLLGRTQLYLVRNAIYGKIALVSVLANVIFVTIIQIVCFFDWVSKNNRKRGRT